ncbi:MAG: hypothetical protein L0H96_09600 [Humibacillus sp.]|nr:hypothetical protein [Humibacillus sp.]MDN5777153.1 hypothetical protein [Humibacillus sp.]
MSQTVMQIAAAVPAGDIFQTINSLGSKATGSVKIIGGAVALILVVVAGWRAKGAIAGLLVAGVAGLVFVFIMNNIGNADLQQSVKDTVVPANGFVPSRDLPPANAIEPGPGPASLPSPLSAA